LAKIDIKSTTVIDENSDSEESTETLQSVRSVEKIVLKVNKIKKDENKEETFLGRKRKKPLIILKI
jgi:hypothetical protein